MWSSYQKNNLGWILYELVRFVQPKQCVEIGCLQGYSSIFIAAALKENGFGNLMIYDFWDLYPFNHVPKYITQAFLQWAGMTDNVALSQMGAKQVPDNIGNIDFIHIDISNNGDTFAWAIDAFGDKLSDNGLMVLEGGSQERDREEWMTKYNAPSIAQALQKLDWQWFVYEPWPSVTVMWK